MALYKEVEIPEELFNLAIQEFEVKWATRKLKIKRFLREDFTKITKGSMTVKGPASGSPIVTIDATDMQDLVVLNGVVEAPWQINDIFTIRKLPTPVFDWVYEEIDTLNKLGAKKKVSSE